VNNELITVVTPDESKTVFIVPIDDGSFKYHAQINPMPKPTRHVRGQIHAKLDVVTTTATIIARIVQSISSNNMSGAEHLFAVPLIRPSSAKRAERMRGEFDAHGRRQFRARAFRDPVASAHSVTLHFGARPKKEPR
jgi:hypothetical protein